MLQSKPIPDPDSLLPHFHQQQSKTHLIISIFPLRRSIINIVNFLRAAAQRGMSREMHYGEIFHWSTVKHPCMVAVMAWRYQEAKSEPM